MSTASSSNLTQLSATILAELFRGGTVSAREIVDAHIRKVEAVNGRLNAVVVTLFESARSRAAALDEMRTQGKQLGMLAGVPFTVKESFDVVDTPTTLGLTTRTRHAAVSDAAVVQAFRSAGGILLGKTNLFQMLMFNETDNPVYGRTNNPWDDSRSPGGSSGGEAAIIAAGGSALGIGSDIGGSVRLPAHSCGVHAIRPTSGRLSMTGHPTQAGQRALVPQPGPMARHVEDLELAMRVFNSEPVAAGLQASAPTRLGNAARVPMKNLRVAFFVDNGVTRPAPAIRRAVVEAATVLTERGAHVEEWTPPEIADATGIYLGLLFADGAASARRTIKRSKKDWRIRGLLQSTGLPHGFLSLGALFLRALGQRRIAAGMAQIGRRSADQYWKLLERQSRYAARFCESLDANAYDAILCPPDALPALRHGSGFWLGDCLSYTTLPVLLNLPAGVVAATRVRSDEESDRPSTLDIEDRTALHVERGSAGLPVGVQVIARQWREDVVLAVMRNLEAHFRGRADYPICPMLKTAT